MLMPPAHLLAEAAPVAVEGNQGSPEIADYLATLLRLVAADFASIRIHLLPMNFRARFVDDDD
jgi:hypothetical protein